MAEPHIETVDALVVGGNLCGLVTAYLLSHLGFRPVLLERGPRLGGANASFTTPEGSTFDLGMHVLDDMRSEVTTRLFRHVIDGAVNRVPLRRGMVLRGHLLPYNATRSDFPAELRALLPDRPLVDDLGDERPTRRRLRQVYGAYADYVYDEVLPAYRCEVRHRDLGVDEGRLMANLYPWFFPRASRTPIEAGESRRFHDRLREGHEQYILYPRSGGFAGFARAFADNLGDRVALLTGIDDLHFEVEPETHRVRWVTAHGRRLASRHVFWCARWPHLCKLLGLPAQNLATDNLVLGSMQLNRPAEAPYNEILVADPSFHLDRVSFPGIFSGSGAPTLQVEFAFPVADESLPLAEDHWREVWWGDLRRLGLLSDRHRLEGFDFRNFRMHYNSFGAEGEARREPDPTVLHPESNVRPVAPTLQNRNLNGSVPLYLEAVVRALVANP